jgi:hypothetical protein
MDLSDRSPLTADFIQTFMRPLIEGRGLRSILTRILGDEEALQEIEKNSYVHFNSFNKIVLASSPAGRKVVWHQWKMADRQEDIEIHNHRWGFVSHILRGALESREYTIRPDGAVQVQHYKYRSPQGPSSYRLEFVGHTGLTEVRRYVYRAGDYYVQPRDAVHAALAAEPNTNTLIIQDRVTRSTSDVFTHGEQPLPSRVSSAFTREELRSRIDELRQLI